MKIHFTEARTKTAVLSLRATCLQYYYARRRAWPSCYRPRRSRADLLPPPLRAGKAFVPASDEPGAKDRGRGDTTPRRRRGHKRCRRPCRAHFDGVGHR